MHALLSQGENQDQIGKPVRPGGEEEGEGRWRKDAKHPLKRGSKKTDGKPVKPTNLRYFPLQDGHCHSPASLLGKENTGMWGVIPTGEGTQRWLGFPCPFPLFYELQQDLAGLCLSSLP